MAQARTLTERELKHLLTFVTTRKHALRNRVMLLMTYQAGLRVGEVALVRYCDVINDTGEVQGEVRLHRTQTKGTRGRVVFLPERLRRELADYVRAYKPKQPDAPLFYTQKRAGFTPNTLCQHFHHLYKLAGLRGASSHSGRRSFITALANKGVGVRVLQALAGHRSIATTQRYIDINDEVQRKAVELI